jgi:hypothetical protein
MFSVDNQRPQTYEKALWPLEKGRVEEDQRDLNPKDYIKQCAPVAERKLGWTFHHLSAKSFSVSIATRNKEVIS